MAYQQNSHQTGQKGEVKLQKILNDIQYFSGHFHRLGGTKTTVDGYHYLNDDNNNEKVRTSVKSKTSLKSGSFDWKNISSEIHIFGNHFDPWFEYVSNLKHTLDYDEKIKLYNSKKLHNMYNSQYSDQSFKYITEEVIVNIITKYICNCDVDNIIVDDRKHCKLYDFTPSQHPVFEMIRSYDSVFFEDN